MKFLTLLFATSALAIQASLNNTGPYKLKTKLKDGQANKTAYNNLYIQSYHIGAGLGDATFTTNGTNGITGYLEEVKSEDNTTSAGVATFYQHFNLSTTFPWSLVMIPYATFYTQWQPVQINAGASNESTSTGFFYNAYGLQWTSDPTAVGSSSDAFGGWLVCDWWHGVPQLFFRLSYYSDSKRAPTSCADVYLVAEYV